MSLTGSAAAPSSNQTTTPDDNVNRQLAYFHPTVWGDHFLNYAPNSLAISSWSEQVPVLKEEVRRMLVVASEKPWQMLNLIDAIQRLGIAYHFEREIEEALRIIYDTQQDNENDDSLYFISLQFRLLRQQGYNVSSDVFKKFRDEKGHFKEELVSDARGLLSFYDASHLRVHGEDLLDEALAFTTTHLQFMANQLSPPLADQVNRALKRPIRKSLTRQEAWHFIAMYQQDEHQNERLLKLAKLDFNMVQKLQHDELKDITKWWMDLDFATKLPFARDRVVECYFWPLGVFFEPKFGFGRRILTKAIGLFSVIDDIYDAYGTLKELELFTKVLERLDTSMMEELPNYMKVGYQALLDLFKEIEEEMAKEGRAYCLFYAKEAMKKLGRAYLVEARWFHANYIPTTEEYISNGLTTSVYPLLITISFCGMSEITSRETFDLLATEPYHKVVKAASAICRLMDDIVSHKFEQSRGHVASAVECYIKQHGVSEQEAYSELNKLVENAWKDINEVLLKPTTVPLPLLTAILNFARVIDVVYKDDDGYTHSKVALKEILATLLLNPVAV